MRFFNSTGGLRGLKRSVYEGGIREPMIIRWPGRIKPGFVSDLIWSHCDLFPTFADTPGRVKFKAPAPSVAMTRGLPGQHSDCYRSDIQLGASHEKFAAAHRSPVGVRSAADGWCNAGPGAGPRPQGGRAVHAGRHAAVQRVRPGCRPDHRLHAEKPAPAQSRMRSCVQAKAKAARACQPGLNPPLRHAVEKATVHGVQPIDGDRGRDFEKNRPGSRGSPGRVYSAGSKETICF